jgi:hypothetical protein
MRWISARPDTVERIIVEFDELQPISRLVYEVEETFPERTQESASRSLEMEVERTAKSWFKNTTSIRGEPLSSARNYASTVFRPAVCVSRLSQIKTAPALRR